MTTITALRRFFERAFGRPAAREEQPKAANPADALSDERVLRGCLRD